jgi:hypothetical protein
MYEISLVIKLFILVINLFNINNEIKLKVLQIAIAIITFYYSVL